MAFMIPVMKSNYDIYNGGRTRKISESGRSECTSLSTSPVNDYTSPQHRHHIQKSFSSRQFSRNHSKTSEESLGMSPTHLSLQGSSNSSSPPKTASNNTNGSQNSLTSKFNARIMVDKFRRTLSLNRKDLSKNSTEHT